MKTIIKLMIIGVMALMFSGCSKENITNTSEKEIYLGYNESSLFYIINNDDSIDITWNKAYDKNATLIIQPIEVNSITSMITLNYTTEALDILTEGSIIAESLSNIAEKINISCMPQIRGSYYTTYTCNSDNSTKIGKLVLSTSNTDTLNIYEKYTDENISYIYDIATFIY